MAVKINTIAGPWISLGIHLDFKHLKIEIHFIWWVIVLGNTQEPIHCGYCNGEIAKSGQEFDDLDLKACPLCGESFIDVVREDLMLLYDYCQMNRGNLQAAGVLKCVDRVAYTIKQDQEKEISDEQDPD